MQSPLRRIICGSVLGLTCLAGNARAELILSGSTSGSFTGGDSGIYDIVNAPDGSSASFLTGYPIDGSFQSGVVFESTDFAGVSGGDSFAFGLITYYNGRTLIGTSSGFTTFDFYLDLDVPALDPILLTTVTFGIDATVNTTEGTNPDLFTASFTQPLPILIGDQWVKFTINDLPASVEVREDTWLDVANVTVTYFSPVPEPSTYGLMGAMGLLGLGAYRRFRGMRVAGGITPTASA